MTKLIIPLLSGETWEVEAEIVGDLALHRHRLKPKEWSITHVPTLMSFNKVVPPELTANLGQKLQRTQLLVWMKKVQEGLLKDWLAMRKFTAQDVKDHPEHTVKVRERIRKHCLERKL